MTKIFVYTETQNGSLKRSSQELLTFAKKSGLPFVAVSLGGNSDKVNGEIARYGASEILNVRDPVYDVYNPELFSNAVCELIQKSTPTLVLASASSVGKDLFPRVAARLSAALVSDATEVQIQDDSVTAKKPLYSGKAFAKMGFASGSLKIILMRPNQLPISESPSPSPSVSDFSPSKVDIKTLIKEVVKGAAGKMDLTEANIIVSGGRGLKEASGFKMLEDLAQVLGATVGASRAVVDAGWVSHGMQVGQTGKTVAPSLYIAVGISGAIQHLAGMSGSKVVVAINSDPNAPIFQKATYGLVGDAFEIVPKLTEEFKKVLQS